MARQKKVKRYDFSGAKYLDEPHEWLEGRVDFSQLPDIAIALIDANPNSFNNVHYMRKYAENCKQQGFSNVPEYMQASLKRFIFLNVGDHQQEYNKFILSWFNGHEGAQETYKAVAHTRWYWNKDNFRDDSSYTNYGDSILQGQELADSGALLQPRDYIDVANILTCREARQHVEKNREQVFVEGDLVVLRKPFVGSYSYDPCWRDENKSRDEPRYGTVMEQGTGTLLSWRGAKGSRQVSVMWFGEDEISEVPEKIIKLECRKGRSL